MVCGVWVFAWFCRGTGGRKISSLVRVQEYFEVIELGLFVDLYLMLCLSQYGWALRSRYFRIVMGRDYAPGIESEDSVDNWLDSLAALNLL